MRNTAQKKDLAPKIDRVELLAPAGSMESFHAAINAGADAVYLGLDVFNARMRAKNFTVKTLSYLVAYAHGRGVKVYVTLNTQLKQSEIERLVHVLFALEQLGVDALIVADLGVIEIARVNFPSLKLHGSTQMAVHNSAGVKCAERLGLSRVVLARELTCQEISVIKQETRLELEVFIHGALCYSISGMCLASSFLGGASGNRGMCTQACRRKFKQNSFEGYFFSPHDLCGIDHLESLKQIGVCSFKIEGRMKGPEYVDTVVGAYRSSIDSAAKIPEMKRRLDYDLGRPKTSFFLDGVGAVKLIDHDKPSGTGLLVGEISDCSSNKIIVAGAMELFPGDRLRIQPQDGFEGVAVNVERSEVIDGVLHIQLRASVGEKGDLVYLVSRKSAHEKLTSLRKTDVTPNSFRLFYPGVKRILQSVSSSRSRYSAAGRLWIKIDSAEWFGYIENTLCQNVVFSAPLEVMRVFLETHRLLNSWKSRVIPALPPFISVNEIAVWKKLISGFISQGVKRFVCTNIGQSMLIPSGVELIADNPFWIMNSASQRAIKKLGYKYFMFSTEDEYLNLRECVTEAGILYVYSHIPLFISRIRSAVSREGDLQDFHGNPFFISEKDGLYYLLSRKPICLTHRMEKMRSIGVGNFLIDLSFIKPDRELLQNIIRAYNSGSRVDNSAMFNFKAGLR